MAIVAETPEAEGLLWTSLPQLAIGYEFPYRLNGIVPRLGYLSLFDRYGEAELGRSHAQQPPRYVVDFGYDAENNYRQMHTDFGFYVHPVDHMQSVAVATQKLFFGEYQQNKLDILAKWLPPTDFPVVRFSGPVHDVGENADSAIREAVGAVVGDIPHGRKTPEDRRVEALIRQLILRKLYADLPEHLLSRSESLISHSEDSPAHDTALWGHDLEALETSNVAGRIVLKLLAQGGPFDERFTQLVKLSREVGARTRTALVPGKERFSYLSQALRSADVLHQNLEGALQKGSY